MKKVAFVILAVVGVIFALVIVAALASPSTPAAPAAPAASGPTTPATTPPATPPKAPAPATFSPISFSGVGDKTTAPFNVPTSEFVIEWEWSAPDPSYAMLSFFLYPRGETAAYLEMIDCDASPGSTYSYAGPGEMYLMVLAANLSSWTITVRPA
jgi:hypothetical protein